LLQAQRPEKERTVIPEPAETQARAVKNVEISKPEPRAERAVLEEINDLVAWEIQHAEPRQDSLSQIELAKAVQAPVVTERPDVVDRTADPLDIIAQINPESVSKKVEQEGVEGIVIDSPETPTQLEDFDIEGLDFEPLEESLSIDDTYLEPGIIEEDVDTLLAELEEGLQRVEVEYMGALLVSRLTNFVETGQIEKQEDVEDVQTIQTMVPETETDIVNSSEATVIGDHEKGFSLHLESLEPTQVEFIKNVIEELSVALKESQDLTEETTSQEKESIDQKLEELCRQLFESLGIECDEEVIKQFIQGITARESLSNVKIESAELSVDKLNYLGTREYKPLGGASLLGSLTQFIKQKMQPHLILGRYALRVLQPSL